MALIHFDSSMTIHYGLNMVSFLSADSSSTIGSVRSMAHALKQLSQQPDLLQSPFLLLATFKAGGLPFQPWHGLSSVAYASSSTRRLIKHCYSFLLLQHGKNNHLLFEGNLLACPRHWTPKSFTDMTSPLIFIALCKSDLYLAATVTLSIIMPLCPPCLGWLNATPWPLLFHDSVIPVPSGNSVP